MDNYSSIYLIHGSDSIKILPSDEYRLVSQYIKTAELSSTLNDGRMMKMPAPLYNLGLEDDRGKKIQIQIWKDKFNMNGKWYLPNLSIDNVLRYLRKENIIELSEVDFIEIADRRGGLPRLEREDVIKVIALINTGIPTPVRHRRLNSDEILLPSGINLAQRGADYNLTIWYKNGTNTQVLIYDNQTYSWITLDSGKYNVTKLFGEILMKYIKY